MWHQLELASEPESDLRDSVDFGRKWFVAFNLRKTELVLFGRSNNSGAIDVKMDGSILEQKSSLRCWILSISSVLDLGSYNVYINETASVKIKALIRSTKFLSPEVALFLYKSTIQPYMEYCYHLWAVAPSCYLDMCDNLQNNVGPSLAALLNPLLNKCSQLKSGIFVF